MANDQYAPGFGPKPGVSGPTFTNTLAQAMGKPVKVAAPDLSGLTSAKGKAAPESAALIKASR